MFWIIALQLSSAASVMQEPKTFTARKKAPKSIQVEIMEPGTNCSIRATKGDRAEVYTVLILNTIFSVFSSPLSRFNIS